MNDVTPAARRLEVLVAGGSGFIGRATVRELLARGHGVHVLSRSQGSLSSARWTRWDLAEGPPPSALLGGVDVVVNLVGIAHERGRNTFNRVHVDAVEHLATAAIEAGVRRLVHVSVTDVPGSAGPYRVTKRLAEARLLEKPLSLTILRPGLVYGEGDVMLTQLIRFVRLAPIFVVPGGSLGALQVVDVLDVARAVANAVERSELPQTTYDIVGPERLTLRQLIARTSEALGLRTLCMPLPRRLMRGQAALITRLGWPLITPTQVGMLIDGLYGDPEPARRDLGIDPTPMATAKIAALAEKVSGPPVQFRILQDRGHAWWLQRQTHGEWKWLLPVLLASMLVGPHLVPDVWTRLVCIYAFCSLMLLYRRRDMAREWLRPSIVRVAVGLATAAVMAGVAFVALRAMATYTPWLSSQLEPILAWMQGPSPWMWAPALVMIAAGEDLVWRGAINLGLSARFGPWGGALLSGLAFALAHMTMGPPVLWAAAVTAGMFWSLLTTATRSLVPTIVSHLMFDFILIAMLA